jgi:hypothetical protein
MQVQSRYLTPKSNKIRQSLSDINWYGTLSLKMQRFRLDARVIALIILLLDSGLALTFQSYLMILLSADSQIGSV